MIDPELVSPSARRFLPTRPGEIVVPLLPAQRQILESRARKVVVKGGVGSGKTRGVLYEALRLGCANPRERGLFVMPLYSLIHESAIYEFEGLFASWGMVEGIDYDVRRRSPPSITVRMNGAEFEILFRSTDNMNALKSLNVAWIIIDEAADHRDEAIDHIVARGRSVTARERKIILSGVPETMGGRFFEWATEPDENTEVITCATTSNHLLPEDFVEVNLSHYTDQDRQRYIQGDFVAPGGRVYTQWGDLHEEVCEDPGRGQQVMACDFGYGCMPFIFGRVLHGERIHYHGEQVLEGADPIEAIKKAAAWWRDFFERVDGERYTEREAAEQVVAYPDPAGGEDYGKAHIRLLSEAGFRVRHRRRHPSVRDRVSSLQRKIRDHEILVDPKACPYLVRCLRHHSYDPRTGKPRKHRAREGAKGLDHGADAIGYHVEYEWPIAGQKGRMRQLTQ